MAAAVVEYIQEALDRNEAPHVVRIARATGSTLKESQEGLNKVLDGDSGVQAIRISIATEVDPETNAIAAKTISIVHTLSREDVYAVYRSEKPVVDQDQVVDEAIRNIMWFPRLEEGLAAQSTGTIASDVILQEHVDVRNLRQKAAESTSAFADFKATSKATPSTLSKAKSTPASAPSKATKGSFFGNSTAKAKTPAPKTEPVKPTKKSIIVESEESSDEDDGPKFVKKSTGHKRLHVCEESSDDEDDPFTKAPPPSKQEKPIEKTAPIPEPTPVVEEAPATNSQKRQKLVTKTRITEEGYMITENVYEDVEEEEAPPPAKRPASTSSGKLPAPPPKKKRAVKSSGTAKQSSMMDFFGRK